MKKVPLLLFANKMDIPGALNSSQVSEQLSLSSIQDRPWTIMFVLFFTSCSVVSLSSSNALTGEGLDDGMTWLTNKTKDNS